MQVEAKLRALEQRDEAKSEKIQALELERQQMHNRLSTTEANSVNNHASWEQNYRSLMVDKNEVDRQLAHQTHQLQTVAQVCNIQLAISARL